MGEPKDCQVCNPARGRQRVHTVAAWCPEHGVPEEVGLLCRCMVCCCEPDKGHKHPEYVWWRAYQDSVETGMFEAQARWHADCLTGRVCDPLTGRHSEPHVGCILR